LIPDYVIGEVRAVVSRKMPAYLGILVQFLEQDFIVRVPPPPRSLVSVAESIIRDHKHRIVLASAPDANPSCPVTDDKDFHTEHVRTKVVVVTASQAISLLSGIGLPESHDRVNDRTIDSQAEHEAIPIITSRSPHKTSLFISDHAPKTYDSNVHTELAWGHPDGIEAW
jgi:hypothetical protein